MRLTISLSLIILSLYYQGEAAGRTLITDEIKNFTNYGWFGNDDPEMKMKSCELVQARGYMCEEHEVETKDGYILTLHRIPGWLRSNCMMNDKVIILQHSFLGASTNFIINSPKQSLGYLFADACFDVWIPNSRGNIYSLKHNTYTSKQKEFWQFSFDDMAKYDLPAVVNYVLKKTSQKSLYYIAHSQGGTIGFDAFTENKDLAKKIRFFGALAPLIYVDYVTSAVSTYATMSANTIHMMHGNKMFFGPDWKRETFIKTTCSNSALQNSCIKLGESLGGKFGPHFNKSRVAVYYMHTPAGGSVQNLIHWAQVLKSKELRRFDYDDKMKNLAKYGSMTPPKINFKDIDVPMAVFYGSNDELADPLCDFPRVKGYTCEIHEVETKDGYILTLHRIPRGKTSCTNNTKVLVLHHGFLASSTNFMINSPTQSLGYLFADACYDVWMPNSRGNTYSLKHNTYTSEDEEFWRFSFDEMAEYDLPVTLEYILKETSQESLYYIGHSQGATIAFMAFSENKELAKKIRFLGTLSPVGYAAHMTSTATSYSVLSDQTLFLTLGRKSLFSTSHKRDSLITTLCGSMSACVKMGEMIGGTFSRHMNKSRLTVYYTHTPAGTSVQNLVHWAQLMRGKDSHKYDYHSKLSNIAKYGMTKPPKIRFDKVDLPVAMFIGESDTVADPTDANRLADELPNVIKKVEISDYSHLDFIFAMNAKDTLFTPLHNLMEMY